MNEDPSSSGIEARAASFPIHLAVLAGLAILPSTADAQEKNPPKPGGKDATGESSPRAGGFQPSGNLLYGDRAPDFTLPSLDGRTIQIREFRDRAPVALVFLEKPDSALVRYRDVAGTLRGDGTWLLLVSHQRMGRNFPASDGRLVLYDRLGEVARMYGAMDVVTEDLVPSLFLIDANGYIRYIAVGALPSPDALLATTRGVLDLIRPAEDPIIITP